MEIRLDTYFIVHQHFILVYRSTTTVAALKVMVTIANRGSWVHLLKTIALAFGAAPLVQFLHSERWIISSTWSSERPASLVPVQVLEYSPASTMKGDHCASGTQLSEGECQQRMKDFPLWDLAPDSRSISRTFVAKDFAEGEGDVSFLNYISLLNESSFIILK